MKKPVKTARTNKEYKGTFFGYEITIPAGSLVSNSTACGPDDNYRFWVNYGPTIREQHGPGNLALMHDLTHYGVIIPAEYCEDWPA